MSTGPGEMKPRCKGSSKIFGAVGETMGAALLNPATSATPSAKHQKTSNLGKRPRYAQQLSNQYQAGGATSKYQSPLTPPGPSLPQPQQTVGIATQSACMVRFATDAARHPLSPGQIGSPVATADQFCSEYTAAYHAPPPRRSTTLKTWEELVEDVSCFPKDDPLRRLIAKNVTHNHALRFESNNEETTLNCEITFESPKSRISETLRDRLQLPVVHHPSRGSYTRLWIAKGQDTCGFPKYLEIEAFIDSSLNKKRIQDGCHVVIGRDTVQTAVQKRLRDRAWDNMCMAEKAKRESFLSPQPEGMDYRRFRGRQISLLTLLPGRRESLQPSPLLNPQPTSPELSPPTLGSPMIPTIEISPCSFGESQQNPQGPSFAQCPGTPAAQIRDDGDELEDDEALSKKPRLGCGATPNGHPIGGSTNIYGEMVGVATTPTAVSSSTFINVADGLDAEFDDPDAVGSFAYWGGFQET